MVGAGEKKRLVGWQKIFCSAGPKCRTSCAPPRIIWRLSVSNKMKTYCAHWWPLTLESHFCQVIQKNQKHMTSFFFNFSHGRESKTLSNSIISRNLEYIILSFQKYVCVKYSVILSSEGRSHPRTLVKCVGGAKLVHHCQKSSIENLGEATMN